MPDTTNDYFKYFMFSSTQLMNKKTVEAKIGRDYVPGTVFIGTNQKQFTEIVSDPKKASFSDAVIVTSGDIRTIRYKKG